MSHTCCWDAWVTDLWRRGTAMDYNVRGRLGLQGLVPPADCCRRLRAEPYTYKSLPWHAHHGSV